MVATFAITLRKLRIQEGVLLAIILSKLAHCGGRALAIILAITLAITFGPRSVQIGVTREI